MNKSNKNGIVVRYQALSLKALYRFLSDQINISHMHLLYNLCKYKKKMKKRKISHSSSALLIYTYIYKMSKISINIWYKNMLSKKITT